MRTLLDFKLNGQSSIGHACIMNGISSSVHTSSYIGNLRSFHETGSDWGLFVSVASNTLMDMVFSDIF